jgi:hypothetical protein
MIEPAALVVVLLYGVCLWVILVISPKLLAPSEAYRPFWRSARFWAALVAVVQMAVYAIWG